MSSDDPNIDKLSDRITQLVPDFVQEEAPVFEQFLKAYYEFLEAEVLVLQSQGDIDEFLLEDDQGKLLVETATVPASPDAETSKLILEQDTTPFAKGEYIVGSKTGTVAKINVINGDTFYTSTIHGKGFDSGETVTSRQGGQTGVVKSFKHNTILANNNLLNYSDVDKTTEEFLDYFQKDFIPSLDLDETQDARLTIKNIHDLYQKKGTKESVQFLLRLLYGQDAEIRYLIDETIQVSESGHNHQRRIAVVMDDVDTLPSPTDKVIQYEDDGVQIKAESIVENVYIINSERAEFSLEISDNHYGTFLEEHPCTFVDRDGVTKVTARCKGILSDLDVTQSSVYVAQEDGDTILLESPQLSGNITTSNGAKTLTGAASKFLRELKVGDTIKYTVSNTQYTSEIATITDDVTATLVANATVSAANVDYYNESYSGGLLNEFQSFGSMYSLNDPIIFNDGKAGRDVVKAKGVVDGLRRGGVEKIFIVDGGTGYNGGDVIVFDNSNADGNAAEALIGAVEDVVILENRTEWGQFEITATAGQTVFGGVGNTDDNGQLILFNDNSVQVFVDGVKKTPYDDYTFKNDRVTFNSGQSAGALIEIFTDFNNLLLEDGDKIQLNTTESFIRSVVITSPGSGYTTLPQCFPGGYIYLDPADLSGYQVGETVTGGTSSATASIIRIEEEDNRLVVKRTHTDVNQFVSTGEPITGGTSGTVKTAKQIKVSSGTGAKLLAYSDEIGGVGSINIQDQGYNFKEDQVMDSTSHSKMLITTPTATLTSNLTFTGRITGSTGKVVNYNPNQSVLTFTDLDGHFLDNEEILFNSVDTFTCLKFNPFQARGKLGAEGIIQRQLVTLNSTLDEDASNLHDGLFYQTHSYIIKVGESINKYRAIVKDLVHPSGHIFFGEVAVKNFVNPFDLITNETGLERENRFNFIPTIIIKGTPTYHVDLEAYDGSGFVGDRRDDESNILLENGYHMILESAPDINAITEHIKEVLIHTTRIEMVTEDGDNIILEDSEQGRPSNLLHQDSIANETFIVDMPTDLSKFDTELFAQRGHVNLIIKELVSSASVRQRTRQDTNPRAQSVPVEIQYDGSANQYAINGIRRKKLELETGVTYYFNYGNNSHPFKISTTNDGSHNGGSEYTTGVVEGLNFTAFTPSTAGTFYYYCVNHSGMGGEIAVIASNTDTVLNIDNVNNPSHSPYERRAELYRMAESGIVLPSYHPFESEAIVLEDGFSKIVVEEEPANLRMEEDEGDGLGARFITEDGFGLELEDASYTKENTRYMATERVQTLANFYHTTEDGETIILEDGGVVLDERTEGGSLTSFVPMGTTIGDLNNIVDQNVFDIAYYLLDEDLDNNDQDRIVLEDGYGSVLLEESKESGFTFEDFDAMIPNHRMKSFDELSFKRTNITWNSYVISSNITNSQLSSL